MSQSYSRVNGEQSPPPQYRTSTDSRRDDDDERDHLVEAFGESDDEGNALDDDWEDDRVAPRSFNLFGRRPREYNHVGAGGGEVLYDTDPTPSSSSAPPAQSQEEPRESRSWFANWRFNRSRSGRSGNNDGVFANLTAKPDGEEKEGDDMPPTYEEAAADATPPYWETTIMTPGYGDELFIEGLPVGSPINFIWNMMVSSAFQFVGFFLTYLLHTSHAAKHGSRAGLGFTLLQCGYYITPNENRGQSSPPPGEFQPSDPNSPDISHGVSGQFSQGHAVEQPVSGGAVAVSSSSSDAGSSWISTFMMIAGGIIIIKAIADYFQARRMELAILQPNSGTESSNENESDQYPGQGRERESIV